MLISTLIAFWQRCFSHCKLAPPAIQSKEQPVWYIGDLTHLRAWCKLYKHVKSMQIIQVLFCRNKLDFADLYKQIWPIWPLLWMGLWNDFFASLDVDKSSKLPCWPPEMYKSSCDTASTSCCCLLVTFKWIRISVSSFSCQETSGPALTNFIVFTMRFCMYVLYVWCVYTLHNNFRPK